MIRSSRIRYIDSNNISLKNFFHYPVNPYFVDLIGTIFNNPVAHPSAMFNLSLIRDLGGYRWHPPLEDYYLWCSIPPHYSIINHQDILTFYRVHSEQITSASSRHYPDVCLIKFNFLKRLLFSSPISFVLIPVLLLFVFLPSKVLKSSLKIFNFSSFK